jgi:hypothetical protein
MKPITTGAEAEAAVDEMAQLIEKLHAVVEQETTLVHAGRLRAAAALEPSKAALAGQLYASTERIKTNAKFVMKAAPVPCTALAKLQDGLRAALQKNIVVLATAHAVSEGIMRRLSGDLARKSTPQVYGASGRPTLPNPRHGRPLALSRVL